MTNRINKDPQVTRQIVNDDGIFPNSSLFILIYRSAFFLSDEEDRAAFVENTFEKNNWKNSWRDGIFDYAHYHSNTHEVLGVYEGSATIQLGGEHGFVINIASGDVIIIPAGVAHKCIKASKDFKCVGAYPDGRKYDIKKGKKSERPEADKSIAKVPLPETDPVYNEGPIQLNWEIQ